MEENKEEEKRYLNVAGVNNLPRLGELSKEDWTYPWIDIPLCDDCYTEVRVTIADRFGIKNWGRIDL